MTITELEYELSSVPFVAGKPNAEELVKKIACYVMIVQHGPKVETICRLTGYPPKFVHDRLEWLGSNRLTTGSLNPSFLTPYFVGATSLLNRLLNEGKPKNEEPPFAKVEVQVTKLLNQENRMSYPIPGDGRDLYSLSLEEVEAICRSRNLTTNYKAMNGEDRKIFNRWNLLKSQARKIGKLPPSKVTKRAKPKPKPKAATLPKPAPAAAVAPEPAKPQKTPSVSGFIVVLEKRKAEYEAVLAKMDADLQILKRALEVATEYQDIYGQQNA